jgi:serine/threonine protein kinase
MDIQNLRSEIERLFSLDELLVLSADLLGLDPEAIGGTAAKASFVRALTEHCKEADSLEALVEAVIGLHGDADPRLRELGRSAAADEAYAPGTAVGPFTIARRIGEGTVSIVYAAQYDKSNVVLKLLRTEATRDRGARERYLTVARLVGKDEHPGLACGVVAGRLPDDGPFYVAYTDTEGEPLTARIRRDGPMHFQQARTLLRGVLETVAELSDRGLSHGNLKLNNVLLARGAGTTTKMTLIDAGVDRLGIGARALGSLSGPALLGATPVAPEQVRGQIATPRTDVYGAGAILWEMLTGQPLFAGTSALELAVANLVTPPRPPSTVAPRGWIPKELDELVLSMLEKDPKARPRDALSVLEELDAIGRSRAAQAERRISDDEFDNRVTSLVSTPSDENAALALESAVQEGAEPARVAQAFQMAAQECDDADLQKSLLYRAGRVYEGANDKEQAEAAYAAIVGIDPTDDVALASLVKLRVGLGKYEEAVETMLARADQSVGAAKARIMAEIGRLYATDLDDRPQAVVAYVQAFCDDPETPAYADEIERLAGGNAASWNEIGRAHV